MVSSYESCALTNMVCNELGSAKKNIRTSPEHEEKEKSNMHTSKKIKKKDLSNYWTVGLTLVLEKVIHQIFLETIYRDKQDKKLTENSQCAFSKGKLHLVSAVHFSDGLTNFMEERRAVTILYFDISKVFDTGGTWQCV